MVNIRFVCSAYINGRMWRYIISSENNQEELSGVKFVRQIVTQDNTSSRAIMWQSDEPIADGAVEYRQVGENKVNRVGAKGELYTDDGQNLMLYTARLENLPAGDKLEYRLIGNGQVGKWHNLSTDDGGAFTALIFQILSLAIIVDGRIWLKMQLREIQRPNSL